MKVTLVVSSGVHQGKTIPVTAPQFVIGRDPGCQLRPASQAVSKQHCGVLVRGDEVFMKDFGSTNGTLLNGEVVQGQERPLVNGDRLQVGPLDFTVRIEKTVTGTEPTPMPADAAAALAAVKAVSAAAPKATPRAATPVPRTPTPKPVVPKPVAETKPAATMETKAVPASDDPEHLAAMLLGMSDDEPVPDGSTVLEMKAPDLPPEPPAGGAKPEGVARAGGKAVPSKEDSSNAANEILKKMMRRK